MCDDHNFRYNVGAIAIFFVEVEGYIVGGGYEPAIPSIITAFHSTKSDPNDMTGFLQTLAPVQVNGNLYQINVPVIRSGTTYVIVKTTNPTDSRVHPLRAR